MTALLHPGAGILQKSGAGIGGEQETGFEQAFSSLAYAYLKDKAPRLLDFMVGFQLVDRNEDNTKAMGVFGFQLGDQWLYAPVFFLNGDLKGHELLYIKKQDMFVPLKENWVNYIMAKRPHQLGERSPKDTFQLGGLAPNIEQLSWPPEQSKFGSDRESRFHELVKSGFSRSDGYVADWAKEYVPLLGAAQVKAARFLYRHVDRGVKLAWDSVTANPFRAAMVDVPLDLPGFLGSNVHLAKAAFALYKTRPGIKAGFDKFYGKNFFPSLAQNIKTAHDRSLVNIMPRVKKAAPTHYVDLSKSLLPQEVKVAASDSKVKIITRSEVSIVQNLPDLTDEERQRLLNDGVLIQDHREGEEVSKAYNTQAGSQSLSNPGDTGLYDVLERPGNFSEMLIVSNPYTNAGQENFTTVVRISDSGNKAWINGHRGNVWARHVEERDKYQEFFDGLADNSDKKLVKDTVYIAINESGEGTTPFRVNESVGDDIYKVDFLDSEDWGMRRPGWLPTHDRPWKSDDPGGAPYVSTWDAKLSVNFRPDASLRAISGHLHVPSNFKFMKLESPPKRKKSDSGCCSLIGSSDEYEQTESSDPRPIECGDLGDIQMFLTRKTAAMRLIGDHHEVAIHTRKGEELHKSALDAVISLIQVHGLSEGAARTMVKDAQYKGTVTYRIKYADQYSETAGPGPNAPQFPAPEVGSENHGYRTTPSIYPQEEFIPIEGLQSDLTDPKIYDPFLMPDQNAVSLAQQAGQEGRKEVFDVSMLSGMLKAVRQDTLVDRYLGDLMKALDRLGRMLFLFYWHQEEFEDRYGKSDLPELEDSLRNSFETLGDLSLFLKEKTIDVGQDNQLSSPSIDDSAES